MALHSMVYPRNYGRPYLDYGKTSSVKFLEAELRGQYVHGGLSSATPTPMGMMVAGTADGEKTAETAELSGYWEME